MEVDLNILLLCQHNQCFTLLPSLPRSYSEIQPKRSTWTHLCSYVSSVKGLVTLGAWMWSCSCLLFWEKFIIDSHMLIKGFTLCPPGFSSNVNYSTFHMFWFSNMFAVVGSQFYCFATFKFTSVFHCPAHSLPLVSSQRNPNSFNLFLTFNFQTCQNMSWFLKSTKTGPVTALESIHPSTSTYMNSGLQGL